MEIRLIYVEEADGQPYPTPQLPIPLAIAHLQRRIDPNPNLPKAVQITLTKQTLPPTLAKRKTANRKGFVFGRDAWSGDYESAEGGPGEMDGGEEGV